MQWHPEPLACKPRVLTSILDRASHDWQYPCNGQPTCQKMGYLNPVEYHAICASILRIAYQPINLTFIKMQVCPISVLCCPL